jgi:transcriptional regulator with XRE-family HTH domain
MTTTTLRVPREVLRRLGDRIRDLREARGLSQSELAALAGLHRTYIGGVERGERNVSALNLIAIARGLGVEVGNLFHGVLDSGDSV